MSQVSRFDSRLEEVRLQIGVTIRRSWSELATQDINYEAPLYLIARTDLTPAVSAAINQVLADAAAAITREAAQAATEN